MGKLNKIGYNLSDVSIIPAYISHVKSRKDVNPFITICNRENMYPIFVAPMGAVTDEKNYNVWIDNKLTPVVPRTVMENLSIDKRLKIAEKTFVSFSLSESEKIITEYTLNNQKFDKKKYICIDLANGHMASLLDTCRNFKKYFGETVEIMTGNIANPDVYSFLCQCGIDWVRCNIGSGSRCTTSCGLGVHYSSATLLDELNNEKKVYIDEHGDDCFHTKLIYDGGVSWYDDINKALALGADAVMIGRLFAECDEACGEALYAVDEEDFINGFGSANNFDGSLKKFRMYSGMSHRSMQKKTGGDGSKVSEGICKPVEVKYPVAHWIENMDAYLRSAMSYTGSFTLDEFRENSEMIILGGSGNNAFKK